MANEAVLLQKKHYPELDSLRGIAALSVVLGHWNNIWFSTLSVHHAKIVAFLLMAPPLHFMIAGHSSVVVFFLLSGFVLSLPIARGRRTDYREYVIKRICRIYLPYLVALAVAVVACWRFHGTHAYEQSDIANTWRLAPDMRSIIQHVGMIGSYDSNRYNGAFWTLIQEMRISLIFPFACVFAFAMRTRYALYLIVTLMLLSAVVERELKLPDARTFAYLGIFLLGSLLAANLDAAGRLVEALPKSRRYLLLAAGVLTLYYSPELLHRFHLVVAGADLLTSVGGAVLILYCLCDPLISRSLRLPLPMFLGRISYSLYLIHGTILLVFAYLAIGVSPLAWFVPFLAVTVFAAWGLFRLVEMPSIALGKRLASRVHPGTAEWVARGSTPVRSADKPSSV